MSAPPGHCFGPRGLFPTPSPCSFGSRPAPHCGHVCTTTAPHLQAQLWPWAQRWWQRAQAWAWQEAWAQRSGCGHRVGATSWWLQLLVTASSPCRLLLGAGGGTLAPGSKKQIGGVGVRPPCPLAPSPLLWQCSSPHCSPQPPRSRDGGGQASSICLTPPPRTLSPQCYGGTLLPVLLI